MRLAKYSHPPKSVSSDFGQLAANRHFTSGIDWAMAGAATRCRHPDAGRLEKFPSFHGDPPYRLVGLNFFRLSGTGHSSARLLTQAPRDGARRGFNIYKRANNGRIPPFLALSHSY